MRKSKTFVLVHFILLISQFFFFQSFAYAEHEVDMDDSPAIASSSVLSPTAVISLTYRENGSTVSSVSSANSKDNLVKGLNTFWTVYRISSSDQAGEIYTRLGNVSRDADINEGLLTAPPGLYAIVLTVTNADGISNSSEEFVRIDSSRQARVYKKVAKAVIKKLVVSFKNGWVGSLARKFIPGNAYSRIETHVLPRLETLLKYDEIFSEQLVGALIDGFMAAGMGSSNARWVAEKIVWTFW